MNSIHGVPSFSFLLFCCCFYLPHKVLNIATISSEPIHMIPSPLPKHYCYLHSKNLHGSCTCKSEISWHYREESPSKQNRCREKKDLKTGIRSYARWHEIEIIMVQIQKHPLRDLNLLAALNTFFFFLMKKYLSPCDTEFLNCVLKTVVDLDWCFLPALDWLHNTKFFPYPIIKEGNVLLKW